MSKKTATPAGYVLDRCPEDEIHGPHIHKRPEDEAKVWCDGIEWDNLASAAGLPNAFQWERYDDVLGEHWSRTHVRADGCEGCCCGAPMQCEECGGREHQDGVEHYVDGGYESGHSRFCEGCGDPMNEWPVRPAT